MNKNFSLLIYLQSEDKYIKIIFNFFCLVTSVDYQSIDELSVLQRASSQKKPFFIQRSLCLVLFQFEISLKCV